MIYTKRTTGEHSVMWFDVAVNEPFLVGVLQAQGRLVHVVAGMGERQGTAGLDHLRQVEALDMLHCQDEALADAAGRAGSHDVGVMQPGRVVDSGEEAIEHTTAVDQVAADNFEHFRSSNERVLGEETTLMPPCPSLRVIS